MPDKEPNELYRLSHSGLSSLVSARVASRVLETALARSKLSADSIDLDQMSRVLLGPVLRDLQLILPREGLKHTLREIIRTLRRVERERLATPPAPLPVTPPDTPAPAATTGSAPVRAATAVATGASLDRLAAVSRSDHALGAVAATVSATVDEPVAEPDEPEAVAAEVEAEPTEVEPEPAVAAAEAEPAGEPGRPAVVAAPAALGDETEHDLEELERALVHFAQLEHTQMVAAVRWDGNVALSRGSGYDLETLSRLGMSGLRLLAKSGRLRSYYLSHTSGQLFLFPWGRDVIVVVGSTELNLGGVFTALTALKEEL